MSEMNDIYSAIRSLESAAEWASNRATNIHERDRVNDFRFAAKLGLEAYNKLSAKLPRAFDALAASERAYDRYVTREPESCSCHINPPCSFCTREADEEQVA